MLTEEQLTDEQTGSAVVQAAFRVIDRQHCQDYTQLIFSRPSEMTESARRGAMDALFQFAALGWAFFHAANKGQPIRDRETKVPPKKTKPKGKAKKAKSKLM